MKTNKTKLLLACGALALLGALALEGCSSSDDTASTTGGTGGTGTGGTSSGGKGGTTGTAGTGTAGTGTAGKGGTGAGGGSAGTGTAGTGTGGTSAAGAPAEGGAAGEATVLHPTADECTSFCTLDATTCTAGNAAYASAGECQTDCMAYALGDDSDATHMTATTGDNFACRAYHLQNAIKSAGNAANVTLHCGHTAKVSTACF